MKDILISETGLEIVDGDFAIGEAKAQNQYLLLATSKGEWKQHPRVGVGLEEFLEDENPTAMFREVREQMMMDGMRVKHIDYKDGQLIIDAE